MSRLELGAPLRPAAGALVVAFTISACALPSPYASEGQHNLVVKTTTGARTPLAATNAWLEIQRVLPGCRGTAEGEVFLRGPVDSLHLPAGRLSNLVFKFRTSSLLSGGAAGVTSYATLIRPREGYSYEATVTYESSLFTIDILEIAPQGGSSRKLPRQDVTACQLA
jgi:hypothetical protein